MTSVRQSAPGYRAGFVLGRVLLGLIAASAVAAALGIAVAAGHSPRQAPAAQRPASRAPVAASVQTAQGARPQPKPSAAVSAPANVDPAQEAATIQEARDSLAAHLSSYATFAQLQAAGAADPAQVRGAAISSFNGTASVLRDVRATPMSGRYLAADDALAAGLVQVRLMWGELASNGAYDPTAYQLAQAAWDATGPGGRLAP